MQNSFTTIASGFAVLTFSVALIGCGSEHAGNRESLNQSREIGGGPCVYRDERGTSEIVSIGEPAPETATRLIMIRWTPDGGVPESRNGGLEIAHECVETEGLEIGMVRATIQSTITSGVCGPFRYRFADPASPECAGR